MSTYWKDYQGNDETFWEHEWGKHGTCISTLDTECYEGHKGQEEVVDYFEVAVGLYKGLSSYEVRSFSSTFYSFEVRHNSFSRIGQRHGSREDGDDGFSLILLTCLPASVTAHPTRITNLPANDTITQVLAAAGIIPSTTVTYTLSAIQAALTASHGYPVTLGCSGSLFEEIWYHYNVLGSVPTGTFIPTSPDGSKSDCPETGIRYVPKYLPASPTTSTAPGSTPTGTPYVGKGFLQAYTGGANKGCLISAGTWYTTGTCATYTAVNVADGMLSHD